MRFESDVNRFGIFGFLFHHNLCGVDRLVSSPVRMTASYKIGEIPLVRGAGLRGDCVFSAMRFVSMQMQNGAYNGATACHIVDGERFPLEMQIFAENANENIRISFFFTRQTYKNFCLEPLMGHLESVKSLKSFKSTNITFCLEQIIPKIELGFFVYDRHVTMDGRRKMMRCIVEANALIPIGSTQLERLQKIQQNLIFHNGNGDSGEINHIYLRQYVRLRRSRRLAHTSVSRMWRTVRSVFIYLFW